MRLARNVFAAVAAAMLVVSATPSTTACPFCSAPSLTLSEQLEQADAVVLAKWVAATPSKGQTGGTTTYELVSVLKAVKETPAKKLDENVGTAEQAQVSAGSATNEGDEKTADTKKPARVNLEPGEKITLVRFRAGKKGDQFLLTGSGTDVIEWSSPLEVTDASYDYIAHLPKPSQPARERLAYFMKSLEHPEQLISNDAYGEFANAPYKEIAPTSDLMPREQLRGWLTSADTPSTRIGLYGLMLGLCGTSDDASLMEQQILQPSEDFRLGIDGLMSGYLLLTGIEGLDRIDAWKLSAKYILDVDGNPILDDKGEKTPLPFSETYSAMQALRFMWTYAEGRIPKERLRESMRLLLDRPELADLVIADLARWRDWSMQDRLMDLYGAEEYNIPSIKRAIVRYMLVGSKFKPKGKDDKPPAHVEKAKKNLDQLREQDPKTVSDAERFFFIN